MLCLYIYFFIARDPNYTEKSAGFMPVSVYQHRKGLKLKKETKAGIKIH